MRLGRRAALPSPRPSCAGRGQAWRLQIRWAMADLVLVAALSAGFLGQALALCGIAGLTGEAAALTVAAFCALATTAPVFSRRLAPCHEMGVAMLSLGGLGMTLGWWVDLGCPGAGAAALAPCHAAASDGSLGSVLRLGSWMNVGMLVLGLPAMAVALRRGEGFAWRSWTGGGLLALSAPAMLAGMIAGCVVARALGGPLALPAGGTRVFEWAGMNAGMLAAMPPAHALAHALARRRTSRLAHAA